jgi:hypothetical protein
MVSREISQKKSGRVFRDESGDLLVFLQGVLEKARVCRRCFRGESAVECTVNAVSGRPFSGDEKYARYFNFIFGPRSGRFFESEAKDEAGGEGFGVDAGVELADAAAVAEVDDAPVDAGEDGGVDAADVAVGEAGGVFGAVAVGAVGGSSEEELDVGLEREDGQVQGEAGAEDGAVDVAGEIAAGVGRERERAEVGDAVVEAEGSGGGPAFVGEAAFFTADGAVDTELCLGVEGRGEEGEQEQEQGEGEDVSAIHA